MGHGCRAPASLLRHHSSSRPAAPRPPFTFTHSHSHSHIHIHTFIHTFTHSHSHSSSRPALPLHLAQLFGKGTKHAAEDASKDTAHATKQGTKDVVYGTEETAKDAKHGLKARPARLVAGALRAAQRAQFSRVPRSAPVPIQFVNPPPCAPLPSLQGRRLPRT
jgi:hypothetical protein